MKAIAFPVDVSVVRTLVMDLKLHKETTIRLKECHVKGVVVDDVLFAYTEGDKFVPLQVSGVAYDAPDEVTLVVRAATQEVFRPLLPDGVMQATYPQ